ncbi:MAG: hypothetical protein QY321_01265 [Patescibacteria group bacterium]|nr:MAG: hypothetical protein QY321_01265 [Patescibacteria group bacterium]
MLGSRGYLHRKLPSVDYRDLNLNKRTRDSLDKSLGQDTNLSSYTMAELIKKCDLSAFSIMELEETLGIVEN